MLGVIQGTGNSSTRISTQSCIHIVRKRYGAEFASKINKSVVTGRRGHLMNSVSVSPGIYSCAVDAFLEISTHLFLPY